MLMTQKGQMLENSYLSCNFITLCIEKLESYHIKILVISLWGEHTLILKKTQDDRTLYFMR